MYRSHKKTEHRPEQTISPEDCFAENAKNWLWLVVVIFIAAFVYAIVASSAKQPDYSSAPQNLPQSAQLQNVALMRCPYCPGLLDAQGRCSVAQCPLYSPGWQKMPNRRNIPAKHLLVRELALEVAASQGPGSVVIQSVYIGGNAEKAGLRAGDKIYRFNGRKINTLKRFKAVLARARPESNVKIIVRRGKKKIKAMVMIGEGEMEGVTLPNTRL